MFVRNLTILLEQYQNTTEGTRLKVHLFCFADENDCKTMVPQKLGGNRKFEVCELVDQFMK